MFPALIALDWGTTSLRAYLLDEAGQVLERRAEAAGVMQVTRQELPAAFHRAVAGWPALPALASGMVGSSVGWVEAPYAEAPAGAAEVARALRPVPGVALHIVPGVVQRGEAPNVMRGEETQILGALRLRPDLAARSLMLLPGTHSKWVRVEDGRIARFDTFMTGELFAVLREHSILGRAGGAAPSEAETLAAFDRGVAAARGRGHAAPLLFTARSLVLTGGLPAGLALDYLSGLLIGEELACASPGGETLLLIGDPALCARYRRALAAFGVADAPVLDAAEATTAGLWHIAQLHRETAP
ncbi:MAG: 2-dehydro-3-deoxygalactonokinase [Acetobacteraceae bacterium]|nr:2-dehydro-3-deoxygalactonokinase [Acetobacteraceae bacterium]